MKSFVLVAIIVGSLIVAPRVASASDGYIGLEVMEGIGFSIPAGLAITNIVFSIDDLATAGTPASRSFARWEIGIAVPALLLGIGSCVYDGFDRNFVPTTTGISFTTIAVAALATSAERS